MHLIWHSCRGCRLNHLWQIFWWSVEGCRFCGGSNIALSHWQIQWPLTQGWRYRAACDPVRHWNRKVLRWHLNFERESLSLHIAALQKHCFDPKPRRTISLTHISSMFIKNSYNNSGIRCQVGLPTIFSFDFRALRRSTLSAGVPESQKLKMVG